MVPFVLLKAIRNRTPGGLAHSELECFVRGWRYSVAALADTAERQPGPSAAYGSSRYRRGSTPTPTENENVRLRHERRAPCSTSRAEGKGGAVVHPDHERGKFVATETGSHVAAAEGSPELGANSLERRVTGRVAVAVVDHLEVVEVQQDQSKRPSVTAGAAEQPGEQQLVTAAVEQPGQGIVAGVVHQEVQPNASSTRLVTQAAAIGPTTGGSA